MELDLNTATMLMMAFGVLAPIVTALLTKLRDPAWWKGLMTLTVAAVVGVAVEIQDVGLDAVAAADIAENAILIWGMAVLSYAEITKEMVAKVARLPKVMRFSLPGPKTSV